MNLRGEGYSGGGLAAEEMTGNPAGENRKYLLKWLNGEENGQLMQACRKYLWLKS